MFRSLVAGSVVGRPGNTSLRLGQIQAAEKNEEASNTSPEDKTLKPHGKVLLASETAVECVDGINLGFDLVRNIVHKLQKEERNRALTFSILIASEKEDDKSNPFIGELKSVGIIPFLSSL